MDGEICLGQVHAKGRFFGRLFDGSLEILDCQIVLARILRQLAGNPQRSAVAGIVREDACAETVGLAELSKPEILGGLLYEFLVV